MSKQNITVTLNEHMSIRYCASTKTLRQMPSDYLIASYGLAHGSRAWHVCQDLAMDVDLLCLVTRVLHKHNYKYSGSQEQIKELVNHIAELFQQEQLRKEEQKTQYFGARLVPLSSEGFESILSMPELTLHTLKSDPLNEATLAIGELRDQQPMVFGNIATILHQHCPLIDNIELGQEDNILLFIER
ncbi:hypothetical protein L1D14_07665 [Vibrio tubiashii]|uniref:hypothetical protein n=1 Tax=Vibrio tubiashii TaxID=29498 RepID=UPI001EFEB022|nr:hypothetical protein [Vibrio tubiashii]MCG9576116.1 hypothetical protein [Vibrio tubiashii]